MPDAATKTGAVTKMFTIPLPPRTPEQLALARKIGRAFQRAVALLEQNQVGAAEQALQEAARLREVLLGNRPQTGYSPSDPFKELQARIYFRQNKYEQAAALYGFRADPYNNLNLTTAIALAKTGRVVEARKAWKPNHFLEYHDFAKPYLPGQRTVRDGEATLFLARGILDYEQGLFGSAGWALEHTAHLVPHNPVALWYCGKALVENNRPTEARSFYQAAVRYDKSGPIARYARRDLQQLGAPH